MTIVEIFSDLLPSWLGGANAPAEEPADDGVRVPASLSLVMDDFLARLKQGLLARFPKYAPDDALAALGRDRRIVRGINEPAVAYAVRLTRAFGDHRRQGGALALLAQIAAYLQVPCALRTVDQRGSWYTRLLSGATPPVGSIVIADDDGTTYTVSLDRGNWNWDGATFAAFWWRFWLLVDSTGWVGTEGTWGDGDVWGDTSKTWGLSVSASVVDAIRAIVGEWKAAHSAIPWIVVVLDPALFDALAPPGDPSLPDGQWGSWAKTVNGVSVPSRAANARYISGPPL